MGFQSETAAGFKYQQGLARCGQITGFNQTLEDLPGFRGSDRCVSERNFGFAHHFFGLQNTCFGTGEHLFGFFQVPGGCRLGFKVGIDPFIFGIGPRKRSLCSDGRLLGLVQPRKMPPIVQFDENLILANVIQQ